MLTQRASKYQNSGGLERKLSTSHFKFFTRFFPKLFPVHLNDPDITIVYTSLSGQGQTGDGVTVFGYIDGICLVH